MSAKRVGVVLLVLVAVGAVAAVAWGVWWYRFAHGMFVDTVARARASIGAHHDRFLEDQGRLGRLPFLARREGGRDAGPTIGPHLRWNLVLAAGGVRTLPPRDARAAGILEREHREQQTAPPPGAWMHAGPDAWGELDFAWMARLRELDRWDVEEGAPPDDGAGWREWEPNALDLVTWARYRIAKGVHEGDVQPALAEVEELARLCFTTERWTIQVWGLSLLGIVRQVREAEPAARAFQPAVTREEAAVIERALWGVQALGQLWTPPEYDGELGRLAFGRCTGLHDGAWVALELRRDLEASMQADYRRLERLLAEHPECRLRTLRERWARPSRPRSASCDTLHRIMDTIPAFRRVGAEGVVAMWAAQPYFRRYDEPADRPR